MRDEPDDATRALIEELTATRTDLGRLIEQVVRQHRPVLLVSRQAVLAWETRAPEAWAKARQWLVAQGVSLVTL